MDDSKAGPKEFPKEYPKEFFVELKGESFLEGRLSLTLVRQGLCVEVALVQKESRKIHKHIETLFGIDDEREALDRGMLSLSRFIESLKTLSET